MPPRLTLERVWWARVHRAEARQGRAGRRAMVEWSHAMLKILSAGNGRALQIVEGQGWVPIPPERRTEGHKQREIQRVCDELGRRLGVGDCPGILLKSSDWYARPRDTPSDHPERLSR